MSYRAILWDVWAEAWARRTVISLAVVVALLVGLYAWGVEVQISESDPNKASLLLFGESVELGVMVGGSPGSAVEVEVRWIAQLSLALALGLLSPWGILFALILTVSFFTDTFRPQRLYWVLSKPISRWGLLLSRFAGASVLVVVPTVLFMAMMTALIGWKTGIWEPNAIGAGLLMTVVYLCFAAVALLVAIWTRSTALSMMSGIGLYLITNLLNLQTINDWFSGAFKAVAEVVYYILPKTVELGAISVIMIDQGLLPAQQAPNPAMAWSTTIAFFAAVLALSVWEFHRRDF